MTTETVKIAGLPGCQLCDLYALDNRYGTGTEEYAAKVLKREVDAACAEYGRAVATWGEHNQITQRAFCRYWDLRKKWERATGKRYGELKR